MGKEWDNHRGGRNKWIGWMCGIATECLRVLKPGGHALVWAIPRTSHWTATAWEDSGFEVRDRIVACQGSGFPKSQDVSKMIDKRAGAEREVVGLKAVTNCASAHNDGYARLGGKNGYNGGKVIAGKITITAPATEEAKSHAGFGTALKPAVEDWWLLRKPLDEKTIAENVLKWGTGALNIDKCRIGTEVCQFSGMSKHKPDGAAIFRDDNWEPKEVITTATGRWPANIVLEDCGEVSKMFPTNAGAFAPVKSGMSGKSKGIYGDYQQKGDDGASFRGDSGSASRFFLRFKFDEDDLRFIYCPKASKKDRNEGLDEFEEKCGLIGNKWTDQDYRRGDKEPTVARRNHHPTVKATELMRWLCRLITPPSGIVLDPFMGSGSTGKACALEGFSFIGIERDKEYLEIARARIEYVVHKNSLPLFNSKNEHIANIKQAI